MCFLLIYKAIIWLQPRAPRAKCLILVKCQSILGRFLVPPGGLALDGSPLPRCPHSSALGRRLCGVAGARTSACPGELKGCHYFFSDASLRHTGPADTSPAPITGPGSFMGYKSQRVIHWLRLRHRGWRGGVSPCCRSPFLHLSEQEAEAVSGRDRRGPESGPPASQAGQTGGRFWQCTPVPQQAFSGNPDFPASALGPGRTGPEGSAWSGLDPQQG